MFKTTTTSRAVGVWIDVFHCFRKWACSLLEVVIVEEKLQYYLKGYKKVKIFLSGPDYKLKLQYNISLWISLCSVYSTVWEVCLQKGWGHIMLYRSAYQTYWAGDTQFL